MQLGTYYTTKLARIFSEHVPYAGKDPYSIIHEVGMEEFLGEAKSIREAQLRVSESGRGSDPEMIAHWEHELLMIEFLEFAAHMERKVQEDESRGLLTHVLANQWEEVTRILRISSKSNINSEDIAGQWRAVMDPKPIDFERIRPDFE